MRVYLLIFIILALAVGCGLSCSKSSEPEPVDETFYIALTPADVTAGVGDTLTFTGSINSVEELFAISFDLVFDTMVVNFQTLALPSNSILGQNSIGFSGGIDGGISVSLGRVQTSENDNISASGVLFEAKFVIVGADTTEILYRDVYIIDEGGTENPDLGILEARGAVVEAL